MSEADPSFETRLESMERRLADIQRELAPEPEAKAQPEPAPAEPIPLRPRGLEWLGLRPAPRPAEPPSSEPRASVPPPAEPARDSAELELLGTMYSDLLASVRRLLDGYETALRRLSHSSAAPAADPIEVTAGPFRDTEALREFQRTLSRLPGVRDVALRGYRSGDRAIIEVQLEQETS
jgi:hypothetical protein